MLPSVVPPPILARIVVALAFSMAAAFCAAQPAAATDAVLYALAPPQVPNPSLLSPPPGAPTGAAPGAPATQSGSEPHAYPDAKPRTADIVLVLPLKSADYFRAAEAVRDGFLAAAGAAGLSARVKVIEHGDEAVLQAFDAARETGAPVVVGPLVRDHLRMLAYDAAPRPVTIALNQLDDGVALPDGIYTLALAIESDGRVLARKAREDGIASIVVIGGDTPLMRRFATAFVGEWLLAGGNVPRSFPFEATPDGLATLRREVGKAAADGALIAVDGDDAALARTFAPRLPAYASALVNRDQSAPSLRDLEEVQLVDIPWLVSPDSAPFAGLPRRDLGNPALDRLYALGLDSFRVARGFVAGVPRRLELDGATGRIKLGEGHAFVREGQLAVVRGGRVVPQGTGR